MAWFLSPPKRPFSVLIQDPASIAEAIGQLDRNGWLEPLLAWWDELSLERVMQAASSSFRGSHELGVESLLQIGRAAARGLRPEWAFSGRRQAIRLWTRLESSYRLRDVWHGLRLLLRFLEVPPMLALRDPAFLADPIPFPAWCEDVVSGAAWGGATHPRARAFSVGRSATLLSLLEDLRPLARSAAGTATTIPAPPEFQTHRGIGAMDRFGLRRHTADAFGGGRSQSAAVCEHPGIFPIRTRTRSLVFSRRYRHDAAEILGFSDPVDPAVALSSREYFPEIDLAEMRRFFSTTDVGAIAEFVRAETWEQALDLAATELARSFAGRVRGFRQASREAVVKQFLRLRGRMLVERSRLLVVLAPTPWAVALHLSGMDESLPPVERMEYRRVEFVLEGL